MGTLELLAAAPADTNLERKALPSVLLSLLLLTLLESELFFKLLNPAAEPISREKEPSPLLPPLLLLPSPFLWDGGGGEVEESKATHSICTKTMRVRVMTPVS